jgi:hypothetical protein
MKCLTQAGSNRINLLGTHIPAETVPAYNSNAPAIRSPDELLQIFRVQFLAQSPYAVISPNVTAAELHEKQPWLYRTIMMATSSHERHKQIETGKLLISELSTAVSISRPEIVHSFRETGLEMAFWRFIK